MFMKLMYGEVVYPFRAKCRAFTLIELLVVIAIIVILAALLLPGLSRSKIQAQGIQCLDNRKQLQLAWHMYVGDNKDYAPAVDNNWDTPDTASLWTEFWCDGTMFDYNNCTNPTTIMDGLLYPYLGNLKVYRCPGDPSTQKDAGNAPAGAPAGPSRTRSMSCSPVFSSSGSDAANWLPEGSYQIYPKAALVVKPADTFVFVDEDYRSINDGAFAVEMTPPGSTSATEVDYPAGYHGNAGGFSFADGHAIIHKWESVNTFTPVTQVNGKCPAFTSNNRAFVQDMIWLSLETTVPIP
jgi:prepilin-type N-terminal cleavage/methylation domain-containing protein